jgi:predicted ATPase
LTLDPLDLASMDVLVEALVPGMPASARARVIAHAQGVPLFAVETIRSLVDRDIVQPVEGAYRLVGQVGELDVPEGLQALLAARLDALDLGVRRLVADAAVLGTTFSADALAAVSGQGQAAVRAGLAELVRREVLSVSADPLSPERGSYRFTHQMLRQVAYDTMSRRDRKARHLSVAAYLRVSLPGDGEEVTDVIAGHYLAALNAVPEDPDTPQIRAQAISALTSAAERAERTGAPALAATSYATAAQLSSPHTHNGQQAAAMLWERAATAAVNSGDWAAAIHHSGRARGYHLQRGELRAAARAQVLTGRALAQWGRHGEAREQLTAALEDLRTNPDADTVRALSKLAVLEVFAGSRDADRLTAEALTLGQDLDVDRNQLIDLFTGRALYLSSAGQRPEAVAYFRKAARLATQAQDNRLLGGVLLNLSETLAGTDPATAAETAQTAAGHLRQAGDRDFLAYAIANLAQALLMLGEWDRAEEELTQAMDSDELADIEHLACYRGWLAALRGDLDTAENILAALQDLRTSEDPQDKALISDVQAFTAAARGQPRSALRHTLSTLTQADALGISHEYLRWAWPLAARTAHDLSDTATISELLALLNSHPPAHQVPMLRAERDLARARIASNGDDPAADAAYAAAVSGLRELSTPFHLAHGLLDHAEHLTHLGDNDRAKSAIAEARGIAQRLRCQPLLDRAAELTAAQPRTRA